MATVTVIRKKQKKRQGTPLAGIRLPVQKALFVRALGDFLAAIVAGRADVMAQMRFTRRRLDRQRRVAQEIVCTMHAPLGWGLFVLLNGHNLDSKKPVGAYALLFRLLSAENGEADGICFAVSGKTQLS